MFFNKHKGVLDQEWFTLKQVGIFLLALLAFTIPWTWRVATTHHEFLLLKATQSIETKYQNEQNRLIIENHMKDVEILKLRGIEREENLNRRIDTKTKRNHDKIENIEQ